MTLCLSPNGPMVHHGAAPTLLFVATIDGVVRLERSDEGGAWSVTDRQLAGRHVSALLHDTINDDLHAATHGHGIYSSADGGRTWRESGAGLTKSNVFSLAAVQKDGQVRLLAGTEPVSLFVSDDRGATWVESPSVGQVPGREKWTFPVPPHEAHLKAIALDPVDPDVFYACIEQGALLKTTDGGQTWTEISSYFKDSDKWYRDVHKLVPSILDPGVLLMTTGMGFYRSEDDGATWTQFTDLSFDIRYPDHLIVDPYDENTVYLSGAGQSPDNWRHTHAAGATVRVSRDGGRTWQVADQGLGPTDRPAIEAMSIAVHGGGYDLFLGNTDGDVYQRARDDGEWTCIWRGLGPVSKVGHYKHVQPREQPKEPAGSIA